MGTVRRSAAANRNLCLVLNGIQCSTPSLRIMNNYSSTQSLALVSRDVQPTEPLARMCGNAGNGMCRRRPSVRRSTSTHTRDGGRRRCDALLYILLLAIVLEEVAPVYAGRDYYDILGVSRDSDVSVIKRAFRKLAREHHPDKNPGDKTAEKLYVELNNAHDVLSDKEKRQQYDMYGEEGLKNGNGGGSGEDSGWGFDPFESMFGGGGRRRGRRQQEERRSPDLVIPLAVSLETLYNGGIIEMAHKRRVLCTSWSDCETRCGTCQGQGFVITTRRLGPGFVQQMRQACPACGGTGKISKKNCSSCPSGQFEQLERALMVDVERGFVDGYRIAFEGQSDEIPDHSAGNVYFEIDTDVHPVFVRQGHDLHYDLTIKLTEALTGFNRAVRQLDGRIVPILATGVTKPKTEIVLHNEGMPVFDEDKVGSMIVHIWVDFPDSISSQLKADVIKLHGAAPKTEIGNDGSAYDPDAATAGSGGDEL
jgi:DnaJ-related protein SCJ1